MYEISDFQSYFCKKPGKFTFRITLELWCLTDILFQSFLSSEKENLLGQVGQTLHYCTLKYMKSIFG